MLDVAQVLADAGSSPAPPSRELLDIATTLSGGGAGYRSFRVAAALSPTEFTAEEVLTLGIPQLIRSGPAPTVTGYRP